MDPSRTQNSEALTSVFGTWPSFHDAEVVRLRLDRSGISGPELEADIHLFEITSEMTPEGIYKLRHHTRVALLFGGIDGLAIDAFNQQNVLRELKLKDISDRQLDVLKWEVVFDPSWGLGAHFLCETISVLRAEPFEPLPQPPSPRGTQGRARPLE